MIAKLGGDQLENDGNFKDGFTNHVKEISNKSRIAKIYAKFDYGCLYTLSFYDDEENFMGHEILTDLEPKKDLHDYLVSFSPNEYVIGFKIVFMGLYIYSI